MPHEFESIGRFKIIRPIGSGGTARVFLATSPDNKKPVALKTSIDSAPGEVRQFLPLIKKEYDLIAGMSYPGLVRVRELNSDDERAPYLTMEYCPGKALDEFGPVENSAILLNLLSSISLNLYYLKLAGLSHGDFKPQNVFLSTPLERFHGGGRIYTKISDFSLALKENCASRNRLGIGTVGYIAPETLAEGTLNHKSDLFAFGIVSYILATGLHPFMDKNSDPVRTNARIKEHEPEQPSVLNSKIPPALSDLIMDMLEKNPTDRPQDAFKICRELEKVGATLSYKEMIRPKHILQAVTNYVKINTLNAAPFNLDDECIETICSYAGDDPELIRHILEINFSKKIFAWDDDGLLISNAKCSEICWPRRLQRRQADAFSRLSVSDKKKAIICTVLGNTQDAIDLEQIAFDDKEYYPPPLLTYMSKFVLPLTAQRINRRLAREAADKGNHYLAALLYSRAGQLADGFTHALDAANEAINNAEYNQAEDILDKYIILARVKVDTERLKILLRQKAEVAKRAGQINISEKILLDIINLCKSGDEDKFLAEIFKELGDLYKMKQDYTSGLKALRQAEEIFHQIDDKLELSHTLNNMGNIYWIDARYDEAHSYYWRAFKIQRRLQAIDDVASTLTNMASIYFYRERFSRAIRLFRLSLRLKRLTGNAIEIARTLNNLGYVYSELGLSDKAIDCLEESLQLNEKTCSQKSLLFNLENLTLVMLYAGRLRESVSHLKRGLSISENLGDEAHQGVFLRGLATVQKRLGYYGQALSNIKRAIAISENNNDEPHLILCLIQYGDLHYRLNILGKAFEVYQKIDELSRKIGDRRAQIAAIILQSQIDSDYRHLESARTIAEELKLGRSIRYVLIQKTELALKHNEMSLASESLEELDRMFDRRETDLEMPRLENLHGLYLLREGKLDEAEMVLTKARTLAARSALLPEMCEIDYHLGLAHTEQKDYERAFGHFKDAIGGFKKTALDIKDEAVQQAFMKNDLLVSLGEEIKKLNALLVLKKGAGL